jgi:hypothetical protein
VSKNSTRNASRSGRNRRHDHARQIRRVEDQGMMLAAITARSWLGTPPAAAQGRTMRPYEQLGVVHGDREPNHPLLVARAAACGS